MFIFQRFVVICNLAGFTTMFDKIRKTNTFVTQDGVMILKELETLFVHVSILAAWCK